MGTQSPRYLRFDSRSAHMSEKILGVLRDPLTIASAGYMALGLAAAGLTKFIHVHEHRRHGVHGAGRLVDCLGRHVSHLASPVAGTGFEPATSGLKAPRAANCSTRPPAVTLRDRAVA